MHVILTAVVANGSVVAKKLAGKLVVMKNFTGHVGKKSCKTTNECRRLIC